MTCSPDHRPDDDFVEQLAPLLFGLAERLHRHMRDAAAAVALPPPLALALRRLDPARPTPMGALAGLLGCDPSYVTGIVDGLEARGLVTRQTADRDRRVKELTLTSDGEVARTHLLRFLEATPLRVDVLAAAERAALLDGLRRLLGTAELGPSRADGGREDCAAAHILSGTAGGCVGSAADGDEPGTARGRGRGGGRGRGRGRLTRGRGAWG